MKGGFPEMDFKTELNKAATQFQKAHADTLQSIIDEAKRSVTEIETKKSQLAKKCERDKAIVYNKVANYVSQIDTNLKDAVSILKPKDGDILTVAEYIDLGNLTFSGSQYRLNNDLRVPLILPFLGHANFFITAKANEISTVVQHYVWQSLRQTAPGQLFVKVYDPDLSSVMSPFAALGKEADMMQVISQPDEFETLLLSLTKDIQNVTNQMRGTSKNLVEFRKKTNQPIGIYQTIVLIDFPKNINEKSATLLMSLLKSAPMAGISFIIFHTENTETLDYINIQAIRKMCHSMKVGNSSLIWEDKNNLRASIPQIGVHEIVKNVDDLVCQIAKASAPPVFFSQIEKIDSFWNNSSADGISFALGSSGMDITEVRLGDDKSQKHNIMISGAVGQGKSNLIKVIIHSLCSRYSPNELNLYLLDFKEGVTLYPFSNLGSPDYLPHAKVLGLESDRDFGVAVLKYLESEFDRRSKIFKKFGDNISKYRIANPNEIMPRIVLIIDEFHFLFNNNDDLGELAANKLESLARKGRSYGIHIILASQSITGASALLTKEDGILGQFPIRIALKNHLAESYATFMQGNDAAAKLRIRGQAVINNDYGDISGNQNFTVAWASDKDFDKLRINWWNQVKSKSEPPMIFDGSSILRISDAINGIKACRKAIIDETGYSSAILGMPINVSQEPVKISLSNDAGRNIAILGAGESTSSVANSEEAKNNAIGMMQAIAVSLALQHPHGNARFVAFDLLDKTFAKNNNQSDWISLMERLGFPIEMISKNDIPKFLNETALSLSDGTSLDEKVYIFGFAMDRVGNLNTQDPDTFTTPVDSFREILRDGSTHGIHFIGWWTNIASYSAQLGFEGEGYIETKIILRLDDSKTRDLLGPFVSWQARDNRALISDQTQFPEAPITIIPFSPITQKDSQKISSVDWGE